MMTKENKPVSSGYEARVYSYFMKYDCAKSLTSLSKQLSIDIRLLKPILELFEDRGDIKCMRPGDIYYRTEKFEKKYLKNIPRQIIVMMADILEDEGKTTLNRRGALSLEEMFELINSKVLFKAQKILSKNPTLAKEIRTWFIESNK